jgi:hypoxanthine phosphoribosyltransferase
VSSQAESPAFDGLWRREAVYLFSWTHFETAIQSIAAQVQSTGVEVDCILGISRGGLVPAVALSNVLGISVLHVIAVGRNVSAGKYSDKQPPKVLWQGNLAEMRGKQVLVVDDVAGSGETLRCVREQALLADAADVRTAVLVQMQRGTSAADFVAVELDDWVVFPWEDPGLPQGVRTRHVIMPQSV